MQFYFFNVTNPMEVLDGETPVVEEKGPYTYREYRPKEDVTFFDNGTKISAVNPKTYIFEPGKSIGDPHVDLIRTVNIPAMTVMELTKYSSAKRIDEAGLLLAGCGEEMFVTHTVHEMLWGYRDCALAFIHPLVPSIDANFGLFNKMNATNDGEYVFLSGVDNYKDVSRIVKWRGLDALQWWTSGSCNMINGTDGTYFHPLISKDETLYLFSSDLCRSLYALYESSVTVKGIPAYRFVPPAEVFANVTENPDNAGFCVPAGNCLGSGLLNVSKCKQDAPIILSPPHFYQADKKFVTDIDGMHPNKEDHETFLDINPLTGILVRAAKRMQVNVYVRQIPGFSIPGNIKTLVFPVMYLNENVEIDEESSEKLKSILRVGSVVVNIPFMIMAVGIVFGIIFIVVTCRGHGLYPRKEEGTPEDTGPLIRTS
ncbi:lysosome membrane protein 2 isoform X2 [Ambystoma mexicanum]